MLQTLNLHGACTVLTAITNIRHPSFSVEFAHIIHEGRTLAITYSSDDVGPWASGPGIRFLASVAGIQHLDQEASITIKLGRRGRYRAYIPFVADLEGFTFCSRRPLQREDELNVWGWEKEPMKSRSGKLGVVGRVSAVRGLPRGNTNPSVGPMARRTVEKIKKALDTVIPLSYLNWHPDSCRVLIGVPHGLSDFVLSVLPGISSLVSQCGVGVAGAGVVPARVGGANASIEIVVSQTDNVRAHLGTFPYRLLWREAAADAAKAQARVQPPCELSAFTAWVYNQHIAAGHDKPSEKMLARLVAQQARLLSARAARTEIMRRVS